MMFKSIVLLVFISASITAQQNSNTRFSFGNNFFECGIRKDLGTRILFGDDNGETEYGLFPWIVAIMKDKNVNGIVRSEYHCMGSLIHPQVVLTVAHRVSDKQSVFKVRAGDWNLNATLDAQPNSVYEIRSIIIHENYNKVSIHNDIALLVLQKPTDISSKLYINTICLPPQNLNFDGRECVVAGWGSNSYMHAGRVQSLLKKVDMPTVPFDECQEKLRKTVLGAKFNLHESFMCAGGEAGKDACQGDGGSPLMCKIDDQRKGYYQAGIVAWGVGCGEVNVPGVYVDVSKFNHWIDSKILEQNL